MTDSLAADTPEPLDKNQSKRKSTKLEILIVLALSIGASAVYSIITIINRLTLETALNEQTATINRSLSNREIFDLIYQLMAIATSLVPVLLALYLLWQLPKQRNPFAVIGFTLKRPGFDLASGFGLAALIGIPGLAVYLIGKELGLTVTVVTTSLTEHWWTIPVLVLAALRAGILEEVIAVGYLFTRLKEIGWSAPAIVISSALLRGTYHLYQGIGPFFGNVAMGILFGLVYLKWGRVMPLVLAHFLIDLVAFLGYPLAVSLWPDLF